MKMVWIAFMAIAGVILTGAAASAQPPGRGGDPQGQGRRGGPPRFELGRVLPPPLMEELELTQDQQAEIAKLEKEVKDRLTKILTAEQRKKAENFRPGLRGGPGGPDGPGGRRGPGGPPPGANDRPPPGGGEPTRSTQPVPQEVNKAASGIQWFATWESGLREAQRTGRPILLVSAAPHCAGVSGTW